MAMVPIPNPIRLLGQGLLCASLLSGCDLKCDEPGRIILPPTPLNLKVINSPYDDWNCGAPWSVWGSGHSILFSSSRSSQGRQFDMFTRGLRLQGQDDLEVDSLQEVFPLQRIAERMNTEMDELGPSIWSRYWTDADKRVRSDAAVVFSRGEAPNHDLIALMTEDDDGRSSIHDFQADSLVEISLGSLNTPQDEGYPTWSAEFGNILFHSNRDGKYRIYQASLPADPTDSSGPFAWLRNPGSAGLEVSKVEALASMDGEERCPLLVGNRLFFVSDRSGGQGGFDIYRSAWDGNTWSAPENLGAAINSASNEYRPFAFQLAGSADPTIPGGLIFSSDRPGGWGGFDLYLAALTAE